MKPLLKRTPQLHGLVFTGKSAGNHRFSHEDHGGVLHFFTKIAPEFNSPGVGQHSSGVALSQCLKFEPTILWISTMWWPQESQVDITPISLCFMALITVFLLVFITQLITGGPHIALASGDIPFQSSSVQNLFH